MNRAGRYAASDKSDPIELLHIIYELPEKDRMLMWVEGYIDLVIEKLPHYAKDILTSRKEKWEDTKEYIKEQVRDITKKEEYKHAEKKTRKEFALYVMSHYREFQSLLFSSFDGNIKEKDIRRYVYRRRFSGRHKYR
ncbi:hypothetical protein [Neobacillus terrae]|uniref:hypothetical protein n=1 Tax=Neobacillus terrae TaxID=3034837 RepID=UPI00140D17CB|nr:hypothetical protein [Neobacillus terrae]NHM29456.1 hypothetical protein [Neobacillus terrae]